MTAYFTVLKTAYGHLTKVKEYFFISFNILFSTLHIIYIYIIYIIIIHVINLVVFVALSPLISICVASLVSIIFSFFSLSLDSHVIHLMFSFYFSVGIYYSCCHFYICAWFDFSISCLFLLCKVTTPKKNSVLSIDRLQTIQLLFYDRPSSATRFYSEHQQLSDQRRGNTLIGSFHSSLRNIFECFLPCKLTFAGLIRECYGYAQLGKLPLLCVWILSFSLQEMLHMPESVTFKSK